MKRIKIIVLAITGYLFIVQQAFAAVPLPPAVDVPEIDGTGAFIAIGLLAGLVALLREKFFRK